MLVRILLFVKHHFSFLWQAIEWLNNLLFRLFYYRRFSRLIQVVLDEYELPGFNFRHLTPNNLLSLKDLIDNQSEGRLIYFSPHGFDGRSLRRAFQNKAFIMMGAFKDSSLVGYFFLRCFWNRKCFVGRLIDQSYEGKGIGRVMNSIMYNIGWRSGFRVLSTISRNNFSVMRSHANNPSMIILKELPEEYMLVEFVKNGSKAQGRKGKKT